MLAAQDILATPRSGAAAFFTAHGGPSAGFRLLARAWHPDLNPSPEAGRVFRHLVALREAAEAAAGRPSGPARTFRRQGGGAFEMRHLAARGADVGEILVGSGSIAYVVEDAYADLMDRASAFAPRFADAAMRGEMERLLPDPVRVEHVLEGRVAAYRRTADQLLLRDLVGHLGGALPAVHAAWLASGLMNLCCWLGWSGLSHGWIGPDTVLVSPRHHSVALTGPFLFATPLGKRPEALPERTLDAVPRAGAPGEPAGAGTDLELARLTVRESLGDPAGTRLLSEGRIPRSFALWLLSAPADEARADYASWETAREAAFGRRRFVDLKVSPEDVYGA